MEDILSTIYIITTNNEKFEKIKKELDTQVPIIKVKSIAFQYSDSNKMDKVVEGKCKNFCSKYDITEWTDNYNLWKEILKANNGKKDFDKKFMILSDNVLLDEYFSSNMPEFWKGVPVNADMVYMGCNGSCQSTVKDTIYGFTKSRNNRDLYQTNGKEYIMLWNLVTHLECMVTSLQKRE